MEQNDYEKRAQDFQQEAKFKIISLDDGEKDDKSKILDDAKEEIARLYKEFCEWLSKNINAEEANEKFERFKQETNNLVNRTKTSIHDFNARDDVKAGKEKAKEFGSKVADTLNDGIREVMSNEHVSKVVDTVSDTIDSVVRDERVVDGVKKLKKGTLKVAENAFNGLKRVLDSDDDQHSDQKG